MKILLYCIFSLLFICEFLILIFSIKTKKFFKSILLNASLGVVILFIINLTAKFTGIYLPLNQFTVVGSSTFGIPAVCGFLILKLIFI